MRNTRIYHPQSMEPDQLIDLDLKASNHALQVLRMQKGQTLTLFDGSGFDYLAKIHDVKSKKIQCLILNKQNVNNELKTKIHLVQSLVGAEKMDFILQKATELGVSSIQPVFTLHSQIKLSENKIERKKRHWQAVVIAACEQCGRSTIPMVFEPVHIRDSAKSIQGCGLLFSPGSDHTINDIALENEITIFIGPEGGLSDDETTYLKRHRFQAVRLGNRILRTETAGIVAISVIATIKGEFYI